MFNRLCVILRSTQRLPAIYIMYLNDSLNDILFPYKINEPIKVILLMETING